MGRGRNQVAAGFGALRANLGFGAGAAQTQGEPASTAPPETIATLRNGTRKMALELNSGDIVVVRAGEIIPGNGTVIEGIGFVMVVVACPSSVMPRTFTVVALMSGNMAVIPTVAV